MGHKTGGTTEIYAKYDPDYLSKAVGAIDAYFQELQELVERPLLLNTGLRVSSVLADDDRESQVTDFVVGVRGFEPPAPASRTPNHTRSVTRTYRITREITLT